MATIYHVVKFVNSKNKSKYAFVPESWLKIRCRTDNMAVISYPTEDAFTKQRVKNNEQPASEWEMYLCEILSSTNDYNDAVVSTMLYNAGSLDPDSICKDIMSEKRKSTTIDMTEEASSSKKRSDTSQVQNKEIKTTNNAPVGSSTPKVQDNTTNTVLPEKTEHENTTSIKLPAFSTPDKSKNTQNQIPFDGFCTPTTFNNEKGSNTPYSVKSSYFDYKKHEYKRQNSILTSPGIVSAAKSTEIPQNKTNISVEVKRSNHFEMNKNTNNQSKKLTQLISELNQEVIDNRHYLTSSKDGLFRTENDKQGNKAQTPKASIDFSVIDNNEKKVFHYFSPFFNFVDNHNEPPIPNASGLSADNFVKPNKQSKPAAIFTPDVLFEISENDAQRPTIFGLSTSRSIENHENSLPKPIGSTQVNENNQTNADDGNKEREFFEKLRPVLYKIQKGTIEIINAMNDYTSKHPDFAINASKQPNIGTNPKKKRNPKRSTLKHQLPGPGLVDLMINSKVYVNQARLRSITSTAKTVATLIRKLLLLVLNDIALKGRKEELNRPALDVMLRYVKMVCRQKGWSIVDLNIFNAYVSTKLQEMKVKVNRTANDARPNVVTGPIFTMPRKY